MFLKGEETDGRKPSKFFGIQMRCSEGGGRGRGKRKAKSSINQAEQEGEGWEMISLIWEEGKDYRWRKEESFRGEMLLLTRKQWAEVETHSPEDTRVEKNVGQSQEWEKNAFDSLVSLVPC